MKNNSRPGNPAVILTIAVMVVLMMSLLPWGDLTANHFKDFNLLEDLSVVKTETHTDEIIDPMLLAALESEPIQEEPPQEEVLSGPHEEVSEAFSDPESNSAGSTSASFEGKSHSDNPDQNANTPPVIERPLVVKDGEIVLLEDYTPSGQGLMNMRFALSQSDSRPVRIAMIGDSYIEGDVFSQNIRANLQSSYGGRGVGYVPLHSEIPGFRQSVRQTDSGWTSHDLRKSSKKECRWLSGEYFTGQAGAKSSYTGVSRIPHADSWNSSKFLFISPSDGVVTIDAGFGPVEYPVEASDKVQCISIDGETSKVSIKNGVPGLVGLGLWINDNKGVTLDCMSLRGNSGITHRNLDSGLCHDMARHIDYDLIIVEYGINALSSSQKDYSRYASMMGQVLSKLKECYPDADIILMGIGDRGQKSGGSVHSLPTAQNMVDAQRSAAQKAGVLFWDTREAMGGADAIVDWRERKLVNADYIHLNHKGGEVLARKFTDAINYHISR